MSHSLPASFIHNFLGRSPQWYKSAILLFLILNPVLLLVMGPSVTGWAIILEFIFTLAMALKCYPLQPGGLIAIEAVLMGLTSTEAVKTEVFTNFPVILLLMFMVAGIYFMKDLLLFLFTKILLGVRSKTTLSVLFCAVSAVLSAFLDALTVIAVIISVCTGFYTVYHKVASGKPAHSTDHDPMDDKAFDGIDSSELEQFRAFIRNILMHAAVGTALGGVCTTVGEPQNLLISGIMGWDFVTFFKEMAPVSMLTLVFGLLTCFVLEKTSWFSYGVQLPADIRTILENFDEEETRRRTKRQVAQFFVQGLSALFLVFALAFHLAEVGLIGLTIIVLQTAFNGITEEHQIGKAFEEALPFTALLVVFFTIVAMIHDQHLFSGIINSVLALPIEIQPQVFFLANGVLSMISDNVFVATVYISEIAKQFNAGLISREHFELLAVAVNTGTNLPSVATPNGQAAFLFLLTSTLAPLVQLSYGRMVWMALPYTIVLSVVGYFAVAEYELLASLMGIKF